MARGMNARGFWAAKVVVALLPWTALGNTCQAPQVGPMQDASDCVGGVAHCGTCQVLCSCESLGSSCLGSDTSLRCLGADDATRDLSKDQFQYGECNSADTSPVGLAAPDPCGLNLCCPATPFVPAGCQNALDVRLGMVGQCQAMIDSGSYSCEASFCANCGLLSGQCDQLCGYGACAVCGDCWQEARLGVGRPDRCDDGNSEDGDGCSSTCEVETGWTCQREVVPIMNQALNVETVIEVDRCSSCTDSPGTWVDSQGYSCQDYETFGACDVSSQSNDALLAGGRLRTTPEYFDYQFLYDVNITPSVPLMMIVSVQAASNAHIFLGKPREYGFEIVLGGWNNGQSVLRIYPSTQQIDNKYAPVLNATMASSFWIYYASDGNLSIGEGEEFWSHTILHGSWLSKQAVINHDWADANNVSTLTEVYITTGWSATGAWDVRLLSGFAGLLLGDLANGGVDASGACCSCGGGVFGRPCDQRTNGQLPWVSRSDVPGSTQTSRRLAGGFASASLLGAPNSDGFALSIVYADCADAAASCVLDAIVVPYSVKDKVTTPLKLVWTQVMKPGCRLYGESQVAEYVWHSSNCGFTPGSLYAVALHLTNTAGSYLHVMDLEIPGLPSSSPSSVQLVDLDLRPGYLQGEVNIEGLLDESNVLQYRAYFGRSNSSKVDYIADERAALVGWINTYSSGGLRNGYNNECLYGDCKWQMLLAKSKDKGRSYPQYILRHEDTGFCVCYVGQVMSQTTCPSNLLTLDSSVVFKYVPTGNGALIDRQDRLFKTVWYRDIGPRDTKTFESVQAVLEQVCNDYEPCVGILIASSTLDGIILLDRRWGTTEYPGVWPPELHPLLQAEGAELAWEAYSDSEAVAPANPTRTSLDIANDPMWQPWVAFIRQSADEDCLWALQDRIFNSTVESRLMNTASHECLCQVPAKTDTVGPDGMVVPAQDSMWHWPRIGKFCDAMVMDFTINEKEVRTTGYCEWALRTSCPSADFTWDVTANESLVQSGPVEAVTFEGAAAAKLTGDGRLQLEPRMLGESYTLAAWVNIPSFDPANASDAAVLAIFDALGASGAREPCLQVAQRAMLDNRPAFCRPLCNGTLWQMCCGSTSTTMANATMDYDCDCGCEVNITSEVENELGTSLSGDNWALGLRACESEVAWDSGADVAVPNRQSSSWLLLAAVADGSGMVDFYSSAPLAPSTVTYRQTFACAAAGCQATAIFRDIPRDMSRTCALDLDVYVTDFTNDEHSANPEIVEAITVRGGAPEMSRTIRRACHPAAANDNSRLYNCVHRENLDAWVLSLTSDRGLRVDAKISPGVDMYAKDGMLLSGVATIECVQVAIPPRGQPKSGSMRAVGKVARSCAESTLVALGGAEGQTAMGDAPSTYLSQAWVWHQALSAQELLALHLETRTRYHRDYQIPVTTEIVQPGVEVKSSGIMFCELAGCASEVTLTGLPTNADARCFLTFKVAMTDFSGPEEVVEYIRIDGHTVVERCWPQVDGDPDNFYLCADKLDVSQSVLRSSFLRDGEAVITAKLSPDVDIAEFRYQNRFMLHAEAEIHCLGGVQKDLAVQVQPQVTHILAAAANAQGEGPMAPGQFFDTTNGFTTPPQITEATNGALKVTGEAKYPTGQLWLFAILRGEVTREQILAAQYSPLCDWRDEARGLVTFEDFYFDPFLVGCEFEPGIEYTLVVYLDAPQEPYGGGSLVMLPFVGADPGTSTLPQLRPRALEFEDTNPLAAKVYGTLTITSAASEVNFTHYHVYYGYFSRIWPDGSEPFAIVPATGQYQYSVLVNTQLLPDVNTFLVFCKNSHGQAEISRRLGILDSSMILLQDPVVAPSYIDGQLHLEVTTEMSGPGARVDVAVVPKGAESKAQSSGNFRQLDFGPITASTVCLEANIQYDVTSGSKVIGPCFFEPSQEYTIIVYAAIRYECPCADPCYCTGQMRLASQAAPGGGLTQSNGYIILPDRVAPTLTLYPCGSSCNLDSRLRLTGHVKDIGHSYPVVTMCAACVPPYNPSKDPLPQDMDPPRTCLRNGDAAAHRYWRIRIPMGFACSSKTTINILEAEFYEVSPLERTGLKVTAPNYIAKVPEISGANKAAAFDGSMASMYLMDTIFDAWLGIDMGIGQKVAILRFRGFWEADCVPSKVVLEWSDDIITWTERMSSEESHTAQGQVFNDVYVSNNAENWTSGAFYQVAYTAESENDVLIEGVTPGADYNIHCWSTDAANTAGPELDALAVTTVDLVGPYLEMSDVIVTDYTVNVSVFLRDPGKAYPALSTCIARETGQALPPMSELDSGGQRCHYIQVMPAGMQDGRVPMSEVFKARLTDQTTDVRIQQSQWGGARQEYRTCGLRQEISGPGGCISKAVGHKVSFLVSVKAPRDIFLFLGQKGQIGYEILLGAFENTRITLSRGYVREAQYENFGPPTAVVSYATADRAPILDPMAFRTFWVDADPLTHVIRVGAQEIFGHNVLIEYTDNNFLQNLNTVLLGAGYWSAGGSNRGVLPEAYVCPRPGNLLLGRFIQSSSVAFNGSPDKAVDGQWGSNTFCEYCAHKDPLHVCASTRRQDIYNPPFFRIAMGEVFYFIQSVRLVVPTDGRPEQSADWSIHVGEAGFRSDSLCTVIADARGDNVWPCNPDINTLGKFVSVWGSVHQLKVLPEEFGIRICEIEAYAREQTTRLLDIQNKFELAQGLPASFPDGSSQSIQIEGLQPNKSYEVFCYGEDMYGNQQYSTTDPITFVTTDTTAPKLRINHIYPDDLSITVEVGLDDPGNAYPALARCMATTQEGKAPQEHEVYFEHRFWRIRFNTQYTDLEPACADRVLLRVLQLQSWAGETFQKFSWSSDPGAPPETIGLDTDGDRLIDSFEIAQWSLPAQDAWVGIDLLHQPETVSRMRSRGFLLQGDLAVAIRWEGNVDDLDLSVIGPGSMYDDLNLTEAEIRVTDFGSYVVPCYPGDGCTTPVLGAQFVLATPGRYNVAVYRRGMNTAADLQISAHVRLCGEELEYHLTLAAEDQNDTIVSGLRVPFTGCHRQLRSKVDNLRNWQSSVFDGGNSEATMWYMADTDETTCMETGGMDLSSDPKPWWRMSLERTQLLQGIWLAGLPGAEMADIFVSPSTTSDVSAVVDLDSYNGQIFYVYNETTRYCYRVTVGQDIEEDILSSSSACNALNFPDAASSNYFLIGSYSQTNENMQSFENGVTCSKGTLPQRRAVLHTALRADLQSPTVTVAEVSPCLYEATLHVPLDTVLQQGTLCAENVPIGIMLDPEKPPQTRACMQESRGSTVWVVAKPYGRRLRLCEAEIFAEPLPTVTQVTLDFGASGNESLGAGCGANNLTVEFSDDNVTWLKAWDAFAVASAYQTMQTARWSWWQRLFALPFHTNFSHASARNVTIPSLRENSTYDVLCWATDAIGNDIMQSMVLLPLPWADTRAEMITNPAQYPGARRLEADNETMKCDGWVRELMTCEEEVATSDRVPPRVVQALLMGVESTTEGLLSGTTERASFRMELRDGSCNYRLGSAATCQVRCRVREQDLSWATDFGPCLYPRCDERPWSNEYAVYLSFGLLRPGTSYTLSCTVSDPWGNQVVGEYTIDIPAHTTLAPQSTAQPNTAQPNTPPPVTQATTTQPRATQPPDYFTRATTARPTGGTGGGASGGTTLPPLVYTTQSTSFAGFTVPPTTEATTTTVAQQPVTLPAWMENYVPSGPIRSELTMSTSSRDDAEAMTLPAASGALKAALETTLQLGPLDVLTILGMEVYSTGGAGRRLAAQWHVRVRFTVTAIQVQSSAVVQRMGQMGLPSSSVSAAFEASLQQELAQRGSDLQPAVVGAAPLQEGSGWSPLPTSPPADAATTTSAKPPGPALTGGEEPAGDGQGWIIPLTVVCVAACIGLLAGGAIYAVCYSGPQPSLQSPHGKLSKVADSNSALATRANSNPALFVPRTPSGRALIPDLRESAKAELQSVGTQPEESHDKLRPSPSRSSRSLGNAHVVNVT